MFNKIKEITKYFFSILVVLGCLIGVHLVLAKTIIVNTASEDVTFFRGRVGIGTSTPAHNLHIYDTVSNAEIDIQSVTGASNHWAIYQDRSNRNLLFWNNNISGEKNLLTIKSDTGNVGIGNTSPEYKLDVTGRLNTDTAFARSGTVGLVSSYGAIPTSFTITSGLWTAADGPNTASSPSVLNVQGIDLRTCHIYFSYGVFTSTDCP